MSINLAEKYRPATFGDFQGSELVRAMLQKMVVEETLPSCMLFTGEKGTGKTSAARIISNEINGVNSMSLVEIDAASNSGVDNIRNLTSSIMYAHNGKWRVVVIDECHSLSSAAFNALLKTIEDPPTRTTFILITTKPQSIPDTVRSRAMTFRFHPISVPVIARRLASILDAEGIVAVDPAAILRIAEVSSGSMRSAIVLLQQVLQVDIMSVDIVNELSGHTVAVDDLIYAMVSGNLQSVEESTSTMFGSSCNVDVILMDLIESFKKFHSTRIITNKQFMSGMSVLWSMRKISSASTETARTQMEAGIFALFSQAFWDGSESPDAKAVVTDDQLEALA